MGKLEPATLAQHAGVEALSLEDSDCPVRKTAVENSDRRAHQEALKTLGKLEPAKLAQNAGVEALSLEDSDCPVRKTAVETRGNLEPATLACTPASRL